MVDRAPADPAWKAAERGLQAQFVDRMGEAIHKVIRGTTLEFTKLLIGLGYSADIAATNVITCWAAALSMTLAATLMGSTKREFADDEADEMLRKCSLAIFERMQIEFPDLCLARDFEKAVPPSKAWAELLETAEEMLLATGGNTQVCWDLTNKINAVRKELRWEK